MAAPFGVSLLIALFTMVGGAGNHLLDYVSSESYWKAKNVEMTLEKMTAEAKVAEAKDATQRVRRLMAIRTLGELKKKEALPALAELAKSKETFVAEYANRAIAAIEDKPYQPPAPTQEQRQSDVWLLPQDAHIVGQLAIPGGQPLPLAKLLDNLPAQPGPGFDKQQMIEKVSTEALFVAELIGDVRVDGITLGVSGDIGDKVGYVVVVVRGQYDSKTLAGIARKDGVPTQKAGDVDVLFPDDHVGMICASDDRFVLMAGPDKASMPVEPMGKAITDGKGQLNTPGAKDMVALIKAADTTAPLWAVARMTDGYRQVPVFAPFDWISLVGKVKDKTISLRFDGEGPNADQVKGSVDQINQGVQEGINELRREAQQVPFLTPMVTVLESVKCSSDGQKASLTATADTGSGLLMMVPMFIMKGAPKPVQPVQPMNPPVIIDGAVQEGGLIINRD